MPPRTTLTLDLFRTTRWSLVARAGAEDSAERRRALEDLCRAYWRPLYAYLRRRGRAPEAAADLVQGFLTQLIEREALSHVTDGGGHFRSWLLTGLIHFERDAHAAATAAKRGGGRVPLSIDAASGEQSYCLEAQPDADPAVVFERAWGREVLAVARAALLQEAIARGKGSLARALLPLLEEDVGADQRAFLADRLGLSPVALRVALCRQRARLAELVLAEVRGTLPEDADAGAELQELARALAADGAENAWGKL